ncbi:MAG: antibiotic biosynthesis monooxygenase [Alphaproteobacteria bacterium]|nr:MAG: antibiotic biosynthesis monooxygenase [Alphaproteobacteria bacterium]
MHRRRTAARIPRPRVRKYRGIRNTRNKGGTNPMSKIALVVDLKLVPGTRERFIARVREHARTCLASEPGCLQFDILIPTDDGERVFLYEVYADQAAIEAHDATPHMAAYRADTAAMIAARTRTACTLVGD